MTYSLQNTKERDSELICHTYARYPLEVASAWGTKIYSPEGREYLDLLAGISVCNLGHCHSELTEVICHQAQKLVHVSNLFYQQEQLNLAQSLLATSDSVDKVFFCNSGAEANEAAIKMARRYMQELQQNMAYEVVTLEGSFHGRTLATLTATGQPKVKEGYAPLPSGFMTIPWNDLQALEEALTPATAAVMLEVIQGEGGIRPLSYEYLQRAQELCRKHKVLFIIDEVQTGMGRTGRMWAHQHFDLQPDMITTSKALANGLPMGALLTTDEASRAFTAGTHATTFGGGALVSATASKVLEIIQRDELCLQAYENGQFALTELSKLKESFPDYICDVRGLGLMLGIELSFPGQDIWKQLLEAGFICNLTQGNVLRLLPALTITKEELYQFSQTLQNILQNMSLA